jgi:hypothetical protein
MIRLDEDNTDARLIEDRRRLRVCDEIEALIADAAEAHTGLAIRDLADYLPEMQRARLRALLDELPEYVPFPPEAEP